MRVNVWALLGAAAVVAGFAFAVRMRPMRWWLLVPAGGDRLGVHARVGRPCHHRRGPPRFLRPRAADPRRGDVADAADRACREAVVCRCRLAGVRVLRGGGLAVGRPGPLGALSDPVAIAIIVALVVGKLVGVLGVTALVTKATPLRLPDGIGIRDLLPVGFLTGIGFTVSLLIAELSFAGGIHEPAAKFAVLVASVLAALLGAFTLRWDARRARDADMNRDGVADRDSGTIGERPGRSSPQ